MTQTRYMTVAELINELFALQSPGARVNVTVHVDDHNPIDGPVESVEKIYLEHEGPAVRLMVPHGAET